MDKKVRSFLFQLSWYHFHAEGVDIFLRIIGDPVADDGEKEYISVRDETVFIHKILHSFQRILAMVEIGTLDMQRNVQTAGADIVTGEVRTGGS